MAKMRIYTVHINPRKKNPYESPIFISESFNFAGFLFHWMWALYHKLWLISLGLAVFWAALNYVNMQMVLHPIVPIVIQLCFQAFVGFEANDMRRRKLKQQGYIISDIVTSDNLVGAEQRYFERYYPHNRLPQTPQQNPAQSGSKSSIPAPS